MLMGKNINIKYMSIFTIVFLSVIVITASFAYFGSFSQNLNGNVAVNINTSSVGEGVFTSSATQLNLQVPAASMSQTTANNTVAAASNTASLNVSLTSGSSEIEVTCTFDIYYEYTGSNYYGISPTTKTSGADKEITFKVEAPSGTNNFSTETNFDYNTSCGPTCTEESLVKEYRPYVINTSDVLSNPPYTIKVEDSYLSSNYSTKKLYVFQYIDGAFQQLHSIIGDGNFTFTTNYLDAPLVFTIFEAS